MKIETKKRIRIDGKTWLKNSISVWDDISKTPEERLLKHPAMFPSSLVERLIDCFAPVDAKLVIDPFMGSASTLIGAFRKKITSAGFEVVPEFANLSYNRLINLTSDFLENNFESQVYFLNEPNRIDFNSEKLEYFVIQDDARNASLYLDDDIADLIITSPPYWNIHRRKRTADKKESRPYSEQYDDLGNIEDYNVFLFELRRIFSKMYDILRTKGYAIVDVMDLRYGSRFIPYHIDIIKIMDEVGYNLEDIIIWNRAKEYNNLRPIGYPYKFIINKVHEYLLVFRKI